MTDKTIKEILEAVAIEAGVSRSKNLPPAQGEE